MPFFFFLDTYFLNTLVYFRILPGIKQLQRQCKLDLSREWIILCSGVLAVSFKSISLNYIEYKKNISM